MAPEPPLQLWCVQTNGLRVRGFIPALMGAQRLPQPHCTCAGIACASASQIASAIAAQVTRVEAVVGAGARQCTTEPSGATIRINSREPKLIGTDAPMHANRA